MDIRYKIQFHAYWHCGSGLAAGPDVDLLVVKDKDGLPFVPGKTIKGLVRDAAQILGYNDPSFDQLFGTLAHRSETFFTDATMLEDEKIFVLSEDDRVLSEDDRVLSKSDRVNYLYESLSATQIDDDGLAKNNSLRKVQVVVPCMLEGMIIDVPESMQEAVENCLKYIKRLGSWRTRGLGRCTISIVKEGGDK